MIISFYKDLLFSVFNIKIIEYKENVKYMTKNNIRLDGPVFFKTKNHIRARTISRSILTAIAVRICNVWLLTSFFCPLLNIKRDMKVIEKKHNTRRAIPLKLRVISVKAMIKYPASKVSTSISSRPIKYFLKITGRNGHLMKSLIAT
jgi:hypothetical protein